MDAGSGGRPEIDPFTPDTERTLASALDEIIPPSDERGLPGAGELGVGRHVSDVVRRDPGLCRLFASGLADLASRARARAALPFPDLAAADKVHVLTEIATSAPEFFQALLFHAYGGYYQSARICEAIGLEPRPPFPKGHEMAPGDLSGLERVRARGRLYRAC